MGSGPYRVERVQAPSGVDLVAAEQWNVLLGLTRPDSGTVTRDPALRGGRLQKLYQDPTQAFPARVPLSQALADVVRRHRCDPTRVPALLVALGLDPGLLAAGPARSPVGSCSASR